MKRGRARWKLNVRGREGRKQRQTGLRSDGKGPKLKGEENDRVVRFEEKGKTDATGSRRQRDSQITDDGRAEVRKDESVEMFPFENLERKRKAKEKKETNQEAFRHVVPVRLLLGQELHDARRQTRDILDCHPS